MYNNLKEGVDIKWNSTCPLCDKFAQDTGESYDPRLEGSMITCGVCGRFRCTQSARDFLRDLQEKSDPRRYRISHRMRSVAEKSLKKPGNSLFPYYERDDFQKLLDQPDQSVLEKLNKLLRYLGSLSDFPGQNGEFDYENDYPILGAKNPEEARFHLWALEEQGLLSPTTKVPSGTPLKFRLTASGWTALERISQLGADSSDAFIAMWFDSSRAPFEQAINEGVANAGYVPIRIDRVEHLNRIDDEMIARIRQSKFLIADFTGQRNGVYFEAGFMLGLGRPVIWVCAKDDVPMVHFDTRQYNTIDYSDSADLKTRLQFRIEANLGKGPHAPQK